MHDEYASIVTGEPLYFFKEFGKYFWHVTACEGIKLIVWSYSGR